MVRTKRYSINCSKQSVTTISNNKETPKYIIDIYKLKTPITKLIRLVKTRESNKDNNNAKEGSFSIYNRLQNTLSKERFYKLI